MFSQTAIAPSSAHTAVNVTAPHATMADRRGYPTTSLPCALAECDISVPRESVTCMQLYRFTWEI